MVFNYKPIHQFEETSSATEILFGYNALSFITIILGRCVSDKKELLANKIKLDKDHRCTNKSLILARKYCSGIFESNSIPIAIIQDDGVDREYTGITESKKPSFFMNNSKGMTMIKEWQELLNRDGKEGINIIDLKYENQIYRLSYGNIYCCGLILLLYHPKGEFIFAIYSSIYEEFDNIQKWKCKLNSV